VIPEKGSEGPFPRSRDPDRVIPAMSRLRIMQRPFWVAKRRRADAADVVANRRIVTEASARSSFHRSG